MGNIQSKRYERLPEEFVGARVRMRKELEELGRAGKIKWTSLNGGPFADMCMLFFHSLYFHSNREGKGKSWSRRKIQEHLKTTSPFFYFFFSI